MNVTCSLIPGPRDIADVTGFAKTNLGPNPHCERAIFMAALHSGQKVHSSRVHLITAVNNLDVRNPFLSLAFMVDFYIFPP